MFESLSKRIQGALHKLSGQAKISESNVDEALKEIRLALLEADVHFKVVKDLLERVRARALGAEVAQSLTPENVLAKLVQDELAAMMGGAGPRHLAWASLPPTVILLAGWTAIPRDIPEACAVDGAGYFRTLFQVTLPMLLPIINVALLFGTVFTFTDMTVIYILTRGGPYDTTQVLPSLAFFTGILGSDLAEGAAISIFLLPLLVLVAWRMLRTAHQAEAG